MKDFFTKHKLVLPLVVFIAITIGAIYSNMGLYNAVNEVDPNYSPSLKIKRCPEHWFEDRQPVSSPNQYLIVNGKRAEVEDYDMNWIQQNCSIQKQIVE